MASNKTFRFGPIALTNTYTTVLLNPPTATGGTNAGSSSQYIILSHIRIINKSGSTATYRLYMSASATAVAGTEVIGYDTTVGVGGRDDWFGRMRLDAADFLVGGASANTALTIEGEGEIGVSG